jgi:hypothetical protein
MERCAAASLFGQQRGAPKFCTQSDSIASLLPSVSISQHFLSEGGVLRSCRKHAGAALSTMQATSPI